MTHVERSQPGGSFGRLGRLVLMVVLPILTLTAYLVWIWPWPPGESVWPQLVPYATSLLTGLPFVLRAAQGPSRKWAVVAYLVGGGLVLWAYAVALLCGVRNVCL